MIFDNLRKENYFLDISTVQGDKVDIKRVGNQSFKLLLPCGCFQVQHGYTGKANLDKESKKRNKRLQMSIRWQWFEFCHTHKYY